MSPLAQHVYEFGPFRLDVAERLLLNNGKPVALTPKAFDILRVLVQNSGHMLRKDDLMREVWPDVFVEEGNLNRHISTLRKALGETNGGQKYIETVTKGGYRFGAALKDGGRGGGGGTTMKSIAVLPLVNEGGTTKTEYLSDGITESIIYNLSQLPSLRVAARNTVFRYKGAETDYREAGRALQVDGVLSGRVMQVGRRLIVRVELVDVTSGWQVWGDQYDQPMSNILAVQREISQDVAEQLRFKLSGKRKKSLGSTQTENNEAYRSYLKGRYFLSKRTVESIGVGLEFFQHAIENDSNYALAYVGIADCNSLLTSYGALSPKSSFPKVKEATRKALKIEPGLAEAHASMGHAKVFERDWAGAEKAFKRAIKINPAYPTAHHWYASYLERVGRFNDALREIRHALKLDPLSLAINNNMATIYFCARQYDQAAAQAMETLRLDENYYSAHASLGMTYAKKGMYREAVAALKRSINLSQSLEVTALLGHTYGLAGRKRDARRALAQLQQLSKHKRVESSYVAIVYVGLKEKEAAFEWLERAYEERNEFLTTLAVHPVFDNIRADERFAGLLRRMGLTQIFSE